MPPKYIRWLRQRRAATKEIRNMMLIGRHRNVVHLYEVLEYIEESKSTMFLILELVRGGELFDLISSSANSEKRGYDDSETEKAMRKYFQELSSGIHYCHVNGIAHRDLKPENLLVHNGPGRESTLKIADFGLSAVFDINASDQNTVHTSLASPLTSPITSPHRMSGRGDEALENKPASGQTLVDEKNDSLNNSFQSSISALGATALTFLTCGAVEDVAWCSQADFAKSADDKVALCRMTSVVGSPHYVAPEIIMQSDDKDGRKKSESGYDGTKADVWSAGVILYAMLFRSLPFGEDLLRCPRFKSFRKWYDEARKKGSRRSTGLASLNPYISSADQASQMGPHWFFPSSTSVESRDLIVAMLNPDPDERLTISMVLQHPWIINMPVEVEFRKFDDWVSLEMTSSLEIFMVVGYKLANQDYTVVRTHRPWSFSICDSYQLQSGGVGCHDLATLTSDCWSYNSGMSGWTLGDYLFLLGFTVLASLCESVEVCWAVIVLVLSRQYLSLAVTKAQQDLTNLFVCFLPIQFTTVLCQRSVITMRSCSRWEKVRLTK